MAAAVEGGNFRILMLLVPSKMHPFMQVSLKQSSCQLPLKLGNKRHWLSI